MTLREAGTAIGGAALLTAGAAIAMLSGPGADCYAQTVQMPCADAGGECRPGERVSRTMERTLATDELEQPLPAGWDRVGPLVPIDCDRAKAPDRALVFPDAAAYGFDATIPERIDPLTGKREPARVVRCPDPPYNGGHEPEGCLDELRRLQRAGAAEAVR